MVLTTPFSCILGFLLAGFLVGVVFVFVATLRCIRRGRATLEVEYWMYPPYITSVRKWGTCRILLFNFLLWDSNYSIIKGEGYFDWARAASSHLGVWPPGGRGVHLWNGGGHLCWSSGGSGGSRWTVCEGPPLVFAALWGVPGQFFCWRGRWRWPYRQWWPFGD